jgi:hypothetical protein
LRSYLSLLFTASSELLLIYLLTNRRGKEAWTVWFRSTFGTATWFDNTYSRMVGLDKLAGRLKEV